jgi:hypothetical protein
MKSDTGKLQPIILDCKFVCHNNEVPPHIYLKWKFFVHLFILELLRGTAKFWGSKIKILLLLEIDLCKSSLLHSKTSFLQFWTNQSIFGSVKIGHQNRWALLVHNCSFNELIDSTANGMVTNCAAYSLCFVQISVMYTKTTVSFCCSKILASGKIVTKYNPQILSLADSWMHSISWSIHEIAMTTLPCSSCS